MAAPAFGTIGAQFNAATTTPQIAVPASVASGDIIVIPFYIDGATVTMTGLPAGFAQAENSPLSVDSNHKLFVVWKRASGADTGTYDFTISIANFVYANALRYTGCVAAGNPWDSPTNAVDGGSPHTANPDVVVTTAGPDRMLVYTGTNQNGDGGTWSPPSGFNQRNGSTTNCEISDLVQATQGSSGNQHASNTSSGSVGSWLGALIGTTVAGGVPYNPQRYAQPRDYGGAQWLQPLRRLAALVATAANDLDVPLLTPEHQRSVYGSSPYRDRRLVPQQPNRVGDMSLFATPANDLAVPQFQPADALCWHLYNDVPLRTSRMQWQQGPRRDPLVLTTAQLENELLGGADTAKRYLTPATNGPRWWMPRQPKRDAYTPGLLDSAQLENELLGGADTAKRYRTAATHYDRREVPQQRTYFDPSLLLTALLENELLGAGDTTRHYLVAATHAPRIWQPQQRDRRDANTVASARNDLDVPLLVQAGANQWHDYNDTATRDRTSRPYYQRWYISDPSLLVQTPTDPLTLAYGVGGDIWRRYNTPAYWDRREVPQQRPYVSDPSLLLTALLEDALLGGDTHRHYAAAAYRDRRLVPQQRAYVSDPSLLLTALLESPLTVGSFRSIITDRRVQPTQLRASDPSLLTPPLAADPLMFTDPWRRLTPVTHNRRSPIWQRVVLAIIAAAGADMDIDPGTPRSGWSIAIPRSAWNLDDPTSGWSTHTPRSAWTAEGP